MKGILSTLKINKAKGMTLTEVIVVVAASTVLLLAVAGAVAYFYSYNATLIAQRQATDLAERGVRTMVQELRAMSFANDGGYPIVSYGENQITFFLNIDDDELVERITYEVVDNQLQRTVFKPSGTPPQFDLSSPYSTQIVSDHIRNTSEESVFTYRNNLGETIVGTEQITDIRFIEVELQINVNPERVVNDFTLQSSVSPRNLRRDI